jgi:hypothetical protein
MIIGAAAGREVRWEHLPLEQARQQLTAALGKCRLRGREAEGLGGFGRSPERVTGTVERLRPTRAPLTAVQF